MATSVFPSPSRRVPLSMSKATWGRSRCLRISSRCVPPGPSPGEVTLDSPWSTSLVSQGRGLGSHGLLGLSHQLPASSLSHTSKRFVKTSEGTCSRNSSRGESREVWERKGEGGATLRRGMAGVEGRSQPSLGPEQAGGWPVSGPLARTPEKSDRLQVISHPALLSTRQLKAHPRQSPSSRELGELRHLCLFLSRGLYSTLLAHLD